MHLTEGILNNSKLLINKLQKNEIEKTDSLIRLAGYKGEITFRPCFGKKLFVLTYYLYKSNKKTIMWDIEPESYPEIAKTSENITNYVIENTKSGSIILLHPMFESRRKTILSIENIVTGLKQKGYTFVTVNELLKYSNNKL